MPGQFRTNGQWKVTTPCIEPAPDTMTYQAFMDDLRAHDCEPVLRSLCGTPYAMGHPGKWQVGLLWITCRGGRRLEPAIEVADLDQGGRNSCVGSGHDNTSPTGTNSTNPPTSTASPSPTTIAAVATTIEQHQFKHAPKGVLLF